MGLSLICFHQLAFACNTLEQPAQNTKQKCSETAKLDRFWLEFSRWIPGWEERRAMKASRFSDVAPGQVQKREEWDRKPFIAIQRVQLPPGKASQRAGSEPCMGDGNAILEA